MKNYDLHSHSTCSDGVLSPAALVELACEQGVDVLAVTDHDTMTGLDEAGAMARELGIELINGVEISVCWNKRALHIVGLNVDAANSRLLGGLQENIDMRNIRADKMLARLEKLGIFLREEVAREAGYAAPTRTHFARALVAAGTVKDVKQAFKRYLGHARPGYVSSPWAELADAVSWIRGAGGTAVLAHPQVYGFTRTRLRAIVQSFVDAGGEAIEVVTGFSNARAAGELSSLAAELGLFASVGSDFHSPANRWAMVGRCATLPSTVQPVWTLWD